jgi:L-threonylcarbamoyladenylate synthase
MNEKHTEVLIVDKVVENLHKSMEIQAAAEQLKSGEVVAFPTETVYGLGGNAFSDEAIERIFQAKGRPSDNPLIVHIADKSQLSEYVTSVPADAEKLMEAFWPGPLTIVLEHSGKLSGRVTAGLTTVGVRMPDHPVALSVIKASGLPLAAPSANTSGRPSPTSAGHVFEDLKGKISMIIDGGPTGVGVESTVVECTGGKTIILRPGGITKEALAQVVDKVETDPALTEKNTAPRSPGMKYTHYAPSAPLVLVDGDVEFFNNQIQEAEAQGKKIGILITEELQHRVKAHEQVILGSGNDLSTVARSLYDSLRTFDKKNVDIIFSVVFPETEIGSAIMNRLRKAAGGAIRKQ